MDADEEENKAPEHLDSPLFSDLGTVEDEKISVIHVFRQEPDEGYLGHLPPDSTEAAVFERFGGSLYTLQAKNEKGRVVTKRSIRLAGDPIFMSDVAEARWRRQNGLDPRKKSTEKGEGEVSFREMMMVFKEEQAEARRLEAEREEKRRREEAERQDRLRREDEAREDRRRREEREWQERVAKEQREHAERMAKQAQEDADRRERRQQEENGRRDAEHTRQLELTKEQARATLEQNNQFFTNMLAMTKTDAAQKDPTAALVAGVELALKIREGAGGGNGEPPDALTALVMRLPETLAEARATAKAAYNEVTGNNADVEDGEEGGEPKLVIRGPLALKVKAMAAHLVKQGKDPRAVIDNIATALMSHKAQPQAVAPPSKARKPPQPKKPRGRPRKQPAPKPVIPTRAPPPKPAATAPAKG